MRIGRILTNADAPTLIGVVILLVFSLIFILRPIIKQQTRPPKVYRLAASIAAILSLLSIALRPQWFSNLKSQEAILLTTGTTISQVQSFADSIGQVDYIFSLVGKTPWNERYPNIIEIPDAAYITRYYPGVSELNIMGHGLMDFELDLLGQTRIRSFQPTVDPGIREINWKRELYKGERLEIRGAVTGLAPGLSLYLKGPGEIVDSCRISNELTFRLSHLPKESGQYTYRLFDANQKENSLIGEKIATHVAEPIYPRILILQNSPTFEMNYLKRWLADNFYQVIVRTRVSKNRFHNEFINTDTRELDRITLDLLDSLDLVIADAALISALGKKNFSSILSSTRKGLGLLLLFNESILQNPGKRDQDLPGFRSFAFKKFKDIDFRSVRPSLVAHTDSLTKITALPYEIEPDFGCRPIITDNMDRILASTYIFGTGQIGTTLIKDSYHWLLENNSDSFYAYWTHIISNLSRKNDQENQWILPAPKSISVNRPMRIELMTMSSEPKGLIEGPNGKKIRIHFKQNILENRLWSGVFWPRQTGWHRILAPKGKSTWFYVYQQNDWNAWQQSHKQGATLLRSVFIQPQAEIQPIPTTFAHEIPLYWFYALFAISISFLWIEKKI